MVSYANFSIATFLIPDLVTFFKTLVSCSWVRSPNFGEIITMGASFFEDLPECT
jgi:hypothetical protein